MGFIKQYTEYASSFTDAPISNHERVALVMIATVLNRKVWIAQGDSEVYPLLWMMLIAESGFNRKSYSMRTGSNILRQMPNNYLIATDYSSQEKFLECLSKKSQGLMVIGEFKRFMGMLNKDYMGGMQGMITELFDCDSEYRKQTTKQGEMVISAPFVSILCASTPEWLISSIKNDDLAGGFLPRFLIFRAPRKTKSLAFQPKSDFNVKIKLTQLLNTIDRFHGELQFSPEAIKYYETWYVDFEQKCMEWPNTLLPFYVRLTDYAKKLSIIYHVDKLIDKPLPDTFMGTDDINIQHEFINVDDVMTGCRMAQYFAEDITGFLDTEVSVSKNDRMKKLVEKVIRTKFPDQITKSDLLRSTNILTRELSPLLETLEDEHKIRIDEEIVDGVGRRKKYTKMTISWINQRN